MRNSIAIALSAFLCATPRFVAASEILNVAVPDRGAWDSSYTEFGLQQGFFKEEGLDVRITYVADQAALESVLVSGKVDIAVGAGFADILGAWAHGAPVKIISPESTGAPDVFWFGKIAGPIASVGDLHGQAVGYSASGYPQVIDAQLAASWSRPLANVNYLLAGEIRIVARANDSPQVLNETTR